MRGSARERVRRLPRRTRAGANPQNAPGRMALLTLHRWPMLLAALGVACSDALGTLHAPPAFVAVTAGGHHSCALTDAGVAYCWGRGQDGELGQGSTENSLVLAQVRTSARFTAITAGESHTCALASDGAAWCWGWNAYYQRGNATDTGLGPAAVAGGRTFKTIDAGEQHACALTSAGQAFCWGYNRFGQLGDGTTNTSIGPVPVGGSLVFAQISAGGRHTCGLTTDGAAYCWGDNSVGQLGTGSDSIIALIPRRVSGTQHYTMISAGANHTCAIVTGKQAYCWGGDEFGQLGTGAASRPGVPGAATPVAAGATFQFDSIRAGTGVTCAVGQNAYLNSGFCWGRGLFGQIGTGTTVDQYHPQTIYLQPGRQFNSDLLGFLYVEPSGETHACGLSRDRAAYCWGTGSLGELGSGSLTYSGVPILVQLAH